MTTSVLLGLAHSSSKPVKESFDFEGKKRSYFVFVPPNISSPAPLILLLHGSGHDGMSLIKPWRSLAEKEGIILVAPNSLNPAVWSNRKDSPDFLHDAIEHVQSRISVDPRRIYLFGNSGGAMYALYLSILESQYFAATAIHAGDMPAANFSQIGLAKRKIPISIWSGTRDQAFPVAQVEATQKAFNDLGFNLILHEIPGHDHDYDSVSDEVNKQAWLFLSDKLNQDSKYVPPVGDHALPGLDSKKGGDSDTQHQPQFFDRSIWADAKPYMDLPVSQLISEFPELHGLEPGDDQLDLPDLLKKIGETCTELFRHMPNILSKETVSTEVEPRGPRWQHEYQYLLLPRYSDGTIVLKEYRTDPSNSESVPLSQGSANMWVLFEPGNLDETRFRYLGHQMLQGHQAIVLAFAQIPDKVRFPAQVRLNTASVPIVEQGLAWIEASSFRILRLRTDLLKPRNDIHLQRLTSELTFGQVRIRRPDSGQPVWLVQEARILLDFEGQTVRQTHAYSNFHLYQANTKIMAPPDE